MSVLAVEEQITIPPSPEVEQTEMEVIGQRGQVNLVEGNMHQGGRACQRVCIELPQQGGRACQRVHIELPQQEGWAPTAVHLELLLAWLYCYPHRAEAEYLVLGLKEGFQNSYVDVWVHFTGKNLKFGPSISKTSILM